MVTKELRMICPACGIGEVRDMKSVGRRWSYKTIPDLELPSELAIPTCTECGELWLDEADADRVDAAAEQAFKEALLSKAEEAIEVLKEDGLSQRELEKLLGVSGGYLSKLRGAERDPSPHLVAALMLLAADSNRTDELRASWSVGPATRALPSGRWRFASNQYHLDLSASVGVPLGFSYMLTAANEPLTPEPLEAVAEMMP